MADPGRTMDYQTDNNEGAQQNKTSLDDLTDIYGASRPNSPVMQDPTDNNEALDQSDLAQSQQPAEGKSRASSISSGANLSEMSDGTLLEYEKEIKAAWDGFEMAKHLNRRPPTLEHFDISVNREIPSLHGDNPWDNVPPSQTHTQATTIFSSFGLNLPTDPITQPPTAPALTASISDSPTAPTDPSTLDPNVLHYSPSSSQDLQISLLPTPTPSQDLQITMPDSPPQDLQFSLPASPLDSESESDTDLAFQIESVLPGKSTIAAKEPRPINPAKSAIERYSRSLRAQQGDSMLVERDPDLAETEEEAEESLEWQDVLPPPLSQDKVANLDHPSQITPTASLQPATSLPSLQSAGPFQSATPPQSAASLQPAAPLQSTAPLQSATPLQPATSLQFAASLQPVPLQSADPLQFNTPLQPAAPPQPAVSHEHCTQKYQTKLSQAKAYQDQEIKTLKADHDQEIRSLNGRIRDLTAAIDKEAAKAKLEGEHEAIKEHADRWKYMDDSLKAREATISKKEHDLQSKASEHEAVARQAALNEKAASFNRTAREDLRREGHQLQADRIKFEAEAKTIRDSCAKAVDDKNKEIAALLDRINNPKGPDMDLDGGAPPVENPEQLLSAQQDKHNEQVRLMKEDFASQTQMLLASHKRELEVVKRTERELFNASIHGPTGRRRELENLRAQVQMERQAYDAQIQKQKEAYEAGLEQHLKDRKAEFQVHFDQIMAQRTDELSAQFQTLTIDVGEKDSNADIQKQQEAYVADLLQQKEAYEAGLRQQKEAYEAGLQQQLQDRIANLQVQFDQKLARSTEELRAKFQEEGNEARQRNKDDIAQLHAQFDQQLVELGQSYEFRRRAVARDHQAELESARRERDSSMENKVQASENLLAEANEDLEAVRAQLGEVEEREQQNQAELVHLRDQRNVELADHEATIESLMRKHRQESTRLGEQMDGLGAQVANLDAELQAAKRDSRSHRRLLEGNLKQMRKDLDRSHLACEAAENHGADLARRLAAKELERIRTKDALDQATGELNAVKEEVNQVRADAAAKDAAYQQHSDGGQIRVGPLLLGLRRAHEALEARTSALEEVEGLVGQLQEQAQGFLGDADGLRDSLEKSREDHRALEAASAQKLRDVEAQLAGAEEALKRATARSSPTWILLLLCLGVFLLLGSVGVFSSGFGFAAGVEEVGASGAGDFFGGWMWEDPLAGASGGW